MDIQTYVQTSTTAKLYTQSNDIVARVIFIIKQMDQEQYQENEYDYSYEYDDFDNLNRLQSVRSSQNPYNVYELTQIIDKIYEESQEKSVVTSLPDAWNLMLYCFCDFSNDKLLKMIDQDQIGRNIVLRYKENYTPQSIMGQCPVCLSQTILLSNPCGHHFCYECWRYHLQFHHTDRNHYELFPNCQSDGCYHKTNFMLIEKIWERFPEMRTKFNQLLSLKYTQKSNRAILCTNESCKKAILINFQTQAVVQCRCENRICRFCRQTDHFPLVCGDTRAWKNIFEHKQEQWLNQIVTQKCPMCKTPINKNGGCIHMTCTCKYQFCWICLKVWKDHSSNNACSEITKEAHQERLRQQQLKKKKNEGDYSVRFQQSKSQIQRHENILKRLKNIDLNELEQKIKNYYNLYSEVANDLLRLKQIRSYLIEAISFELNSEIYVFFQLPNHKKLKKSLKLFSQKNSELDDYLTSKLAVLSSPLVQLTKEGTSASLKEVQGMITAIKIDFIQSRDYYVEIFKTVKKMSEVLKNFSFMSQ